MKSPLELMAGLKDLEMPVAVLTDSDAPPALESVTTQAAAAAVQVFVFIFTLHLLRSGALDQRGPQGMSDGQRDPSMGTAP